MATRCQVLVMAREAQGEPAVSLYHHWDGYPGNMLRLLAESWERVLMAGDEAGRATLRAQEPVYASRGPNAFASSGGWTPERHGKSARRLAISRGCAPLKMANWIIAQDPDGYEIEPVGTVHGDIEYLYRVAPVGEGEGEDAEDSWQVQVESRGLSDAERWSVLIPWCRLDDPRVDAEIADHERRVAAWAAATV